MNIPSFCEIRGLTIQNPFYTYCANHPYHRPNRDPIPIGPVYVHSDSGSREFWQPSPDTEEIRQHLLDIVRTPEENADRYPFFSQPLYMKAIHQLVDFGDRRLVEALEDFAEQAQDEEARSSLRATINRVQGMLGQ